jgi:hypothetical protein
MEKAKFETNREKVIEASPDPDPDPTPPKEVRIDSGSIKSYKNHSHIVRPSHRLDPEGGNEQKLEDSLPQHVGDGDASSGDIEMADDPSNSHQV